MINFYSGRPGNGKSLHMAQVIYKSLKKGKNVIANFEINERYFERFNRKHPGKLGHFIYMPPAYWNYNAIGTHRNTEHKVTVSAPVGAAVYVNGTYKGEAPCSFTKMLGSVTVTLTKENCETKSYSIEIPDDSQDISWSFPALEKKGSG